MKTLGYLVVSMRPKQWTKNLVVYLALIFSVNLYWQVGNREEMVVKLSQATAAFLLFCLISGAVYLFNDLMDLEVDRGHPWKRNRPLAAGRLGRGAAATAATAATAAALALSLWLDPTFGLIAVIYLLLQAGYSLVLKHQIILDVLAIAIGFVLRAGAGAVVIHVPISPWLYICTILGALFLSLAKRRQEAVLVGNPTPRGGIATGYSRELVDQMLAVVTPSTVIAYSLYTFTAPNLPTNHSMMLTVPFVLYGIFRYLYLIHSQDLGASPEEVLLRDPPLILTILLWVGVSMGILLIFPRA